MYNCENRRIHFFFKDKLYINEMFSFFCNFQMSGKRSRSFKCAVHHRDREVCSESDFHLVFEDPPFFKR